MSRVTGMPRLREGGGFLHHESGERPLGLLSHVRHAFVGRVVVGMQRVEVLFMQVPNDGDYCKVFSEFLSHENSYMIAILAINCFVGDFCSLYNSLTLGVPKGVGAVGASDPAFAQA